MAVIFPLPPGSNGPSSVFTWAPPNPPHGVQTPGGSCLGASLQRQSRAAAPWRGAPPPWRGAPWRGQPLPPAPGPSAGRCTHSARGDPPHEGLDQLRPPGRLCCPTAGASSTPFCHPEALPHLRPPCKCLLPCVFAPWGQASPPVLLPPGPGPKEEKLPLPVSWDLVLPGRRAGGRPGPPAAATATGTRSGRQPPLRCKLTAGIDHQLWTPGRSPPEDGHARAPGHQPPPPSPAQPLKGGKRGNDVDK